MPEQPSASISTASNASADESSPHHGLAGTPPSATSPSTVSASILRSGPFAPDLDCHSPGCPRGRSSLTPSAKDLPADPSSSVLLSPDAPAAQPRAYPIDQPQEATPPFPQRPRPPLPLHVTPPGPRASVVPAARPSPLQLTPSFTSPLSSLATDAAISPPTSRDARSARAGAHSALRLQTDTTHASALSAALAASHRQLPDTHAFCTSTTPTALTAIHTNVVSGCGSSLKPVSRTPSLKQHGFGPASTANSTVASPIIAAMGDVTPLPSPLLSGDSPGPWKKLGRSPPSDAPYIQPTTMSGSALFTANGESVAAASTQQAKRKAYAGLLVGQPPPQNGDGGGNTSQSSRRLPHTRERSLSEYVPDPMLLPRRMVTVSASHSNPIGAPGQTEAKYEHYMRREPHLSESRGLTSVSKPPTPPPSESSLLCSDGAVSSEQFPWQQPTGERYEYFEARDREHSKRRRWRAIRQLGQGTFSRVILATSDLNFPSDGNEDAGASSLPTRAVYKKRYDRRALVAVKICEHGPKGGASEDRVEMSLKRELEIMQCICHPSLVRLKAWDIEPTRAILVLSYCPGGDLFDVASAHRDLLTAPLLARIFAELVGAVSYLHHLHIVHRDIKLENVLVNLPPKELASISIDWTTYQYSVITLTDLGLSRRVADDEKLETRCGSDDYAAPEVIMGQPYDGRATDAWSLGVLLYALLEGRLPFDPNPGINDARRMRSRTSHRIARVEWRWFEFAGDDSDHEGDIAKFQAKGLLGAMEITEGLLKRARSRWSMPEVAEAPWVRNAMAIPGGLRFREEEEGQEVL